MCAIEGHSLNMITTVTMKLRITSSFPYLQQQITRHPLHTLITRAREGFKPRHRQQQLQLQHSQLQRCVSKSHRHHASRSRSHRPTKSLASGTMHLTLHARLSSLDPACHGPRSTRHTPDGLRTFTIGAVLGVEQPGRSPLCATLPPTKSPIP